MSAIEHITKIRERVYDLSSTIATVLHKLQEVNYAISPYRLYYRRHIPCYLYLFYTRLACTRLVSDRGIVIQPIKVFGCEGLLTQFVTEGLDGVDMTECQLIAEGQMHRGRFVFGFVDFHLADKTQDDIRCLKIEL